MKYTTVAMYKISSWDSYAIPELVTFLTQEGLKKRFFRDSYRGNGITVDYQTGFDRYHPRSNLRPSGLFVTISTNDTEIGKTFIAKFDRWAKKLVKEYPKYSLENRS